MKITIDNSALGHAAFADWYRYGTPARRPPSLLIYFGGRISSEVYEARRDTEPTDILQLFMHTCRKRSVTCADLLVVPCPLIDHSEPDFRARIEEFIFLEVLPRTPTPVTSRMALLGNSMGAHIAAMIAFELDAVVALGTIAGVGMAEAADRSSSRLFGSKVYLSFSNVDDPYAEHTQRFRETMKREGHRVDVVERAGGHEFADYMANGSAGDAFRRMINSMR